MSNSPSSDLFLTVSDAKQDMMRTVLMLLEGVDNIPQKFYCSPQLELCLHQSEIMFTSALSQPPARVSTFFTQPSQSATAQILNNSTKFGQYLS